MLSIIIFCVISNETVNWANKFLRWQAINVSIKARSQWERQRHDNDTTPLWPQLRHDSDIPATFPLWPPFATRQWHDISAKATQHIVTTSCRRSVAKMSCRCRVAKCGHNGNRCRVTGMSLSCRRLLWSKVFDFFSRITGPIRIKFGMSILCVHTTNHAKFQIFWFWQKTTKIFAENRRKFEIFAKIRPKNCKNSWYY